MFAGDIHLTYVDNDVSNIESCLSEDVLPHFDVLCDLLLNRRTTTWNIFVLYNRELKYTEKKF